MRNDPSNDDPSINFVEHCAPEPTATPISAQDRLVAEYAAAKRRLSSPRTAESDWYNQKTEPPRTYACNKSEAFAAEAIPKTEVDQSDWQIHPRIFFRYNAELGPFDVDAACDLQGRNALVPAYWTTKDDLTQQDWAHQNTWCNVPFHLAFEALQRFLCCKQLSPEDTTATFVIPAWPGTPAWNLAMETFQLVDYYPPYSDLFTATPLKAGEARRASGPVKFPVAVITCPPGPIPKDDASFAKFKTVPVWRHQDQFKAVESLKLPENMNPSIQRKFRDLFSRHEQTFANSNMDLGCGTLGTHRINTGDAPPIKQRAYRHSRPDNEFIGDTLDELRKHGIVEPCESSWASPVVVVEKKEEGACRLCVDQRRVNDVTATDSCPMPTAEALIDDLEHTSVFSTLDMWVLSDTYGPRRPGQDS